MKVRVRMVPSEPFRESRAMQCECAITSDALERLRLRFFHFCIWDEHRPKLVRLKPAVAVCIQAIESFTEMPQEFVL